MRRIARAILLAILFPLRPVCFWREWGIVQDVAIDFFGLTKIKAVIAASNASTAAACDKERDYALSDLERRMTRDHELAVSRLEGQIETLNGKIGKMKAKSREADNSLYVAKVQIKENVRVAVLLTSEANDLADTALKVGSKVGALHSLCTTHVKRVEDVAKGKKVAVASHED